VLLKNRFGYDDSLDAFGVHGVGGLAGALLTGVFAQKVLNEAGADGALFGNVRQLGVQLLACAATGGYSVVLTYGILKVLDATIGLRVPENEEREGLDATQHGEEAYGESGGTAYEMQGATDEERGAVATKEATAE
jgi:Amt family ammonium transporter